MPDTPRSTISADAGLVTLINVFTCAEERQNALVDALDRATAEIFVHVPGFVSANIHASADRTRVVNYAQWATTAHFEAMQGRRDVQYHMSEIMAVADSADPRLYEVRSVHRG